jgi:hypothetical protein
MVFFVLKGFEVRGSPHDGTCPPAPFFFGTEIFNPQKKKSAKIKCLLFSPKPQKFHTAEITGYTVCI